MAVLEQAISGELINIKIPPRPAVLLKVQQEMRGPDPDMRTIEQIISLDVGISASLVKIANSPLFGASRQVRSIKDALQVLGLDAVAAAIAALALRQSFAKVPNLERFWDSSARIAQISGWLVPHLAFGERRIRQDEAYTFGLFRDCGIPVLLSMYSDYFEILKAANETADRPFTAVEQDELDLDHALIGGMLAREWELPAEFCAGIESHHEAEAIRGAGSRALPDVSRYLIAVAQLAEFIFQSLTGLNRTCEWPKLGEACMAALSLDAQGVENLVAQAAEVDVHSRPML